MVEQGESGLPTIVAGVGSVLVLGAAIWGSRKPDESGAPTRPGLLLYAMVCSVTLYAAGTLMRLF